MKKPYVVAVAGGTCSGKSTLTDSLGKVLKKDYRVNIIHIDRYFKKNPPTTIAPITGKTYEEHNHPNTIELDCLERDFVAARLGKYDFVMIEGLFALYLDFIRLQADLKVFVDLESDERLVRRIRRNMERGGDFDEIAERYLDTVRFRHNELIEPTRWYADIVVNGILEQNKALLVLEAFLRTIDC